MKKIKNISAFTLIEMIVAITIFTIFISMIVGTYLFIARAQRDAAEARKYYSGARDVMEEITKEVKLNKIYYLCYEATITGVLGCSAVDLGQGLPVANLALINGEENHLMIFSLSDFVTLMEYEIDENTLGWVAASGYEDGALQISATGVDISSLNFRIFPYADPEENYDDTAYQFMPYVTVYLTVLDGNGSDYSLETTASTRIYE
ncbi:MAG: type II secretion system protein [Candidatus Gracilibacteria bacterium]|jgi:prepilin-type N-terminal cleavage/methylation domain-containing protein